MKKILILLLFAAANFIASAKAPDLNVEKLFDKNCRDEKGVQLTISKNRDNYYRCMTIYDNPELIKRIMEAIDKDEERAETINDHFGSGGRYRNLKIKNNGAIINIGIQTNKEETKGTFFITGKAVAFK